MGSAREFRLRLLFEKKRDGRFYVCSPDLAGLHLAGSDLDKIRADLEPVIKELLFFNSDFVADTIKWVPSFDQAMHNVKQSLSPPRGQPAEEIFVITGRAA